MIERLIHVYGPWGEHPDHPIVDTWKYEVVKAAPRHHVIIAPGGLLPDLNPNFPPPPAGRSDAPFSCH
jgi:hypothetical protein